MDDCEISNSFGTLRMKDVQKQWWLPRLKSMGFTPNGLTALSFLFSVLFNFCFYKGFYMWASICLFLRARFDSLDGQYAREYNMVTEFGDWFDHLNDVLAFSLPFVIILYIKIKHYSVLQQVLIVIGILVPHLVMLSSFACSLKCEKFQKEKKTVSWLHNICYQQQVYGYFEHYLLMSVIFLALGIWSHLK